MAAGLSTRYFDFSQTSGGCFPPIDPDGTLFPGRGRLRGGPVEGPERPHRFSFVFLLGLYELTSEFI